MRYILDIFPISDNEFIIILIVGTWSVRNDIGYSPVSGEEFKIILILGAEWVRNN